MTFAKTAVITAGFLGAFGLGVWSGPYLMHRAPDQTVAVVEPTASADQAATVVEHPTPQAIGRPRAVGVARVEMKHTIATATAVNGVAVDKPELHQRLKPLLKSGANMNLAAEGFRSAEQFATVAHASQNTNVPFMLLKHRVLEEGDTLVAAIRKSKPAVDAVAEADRAREEAKSDLSSLD